MLKPPLTHIVQHHSRVRAAVTPDRVRLIRLTEVAAHTQEAFDRARVMMAPVRFLDVCFQHNLTDWTKDECRGS